MTQRFPFLDHLTIEQAETVERWRWEWRDQSILHAALHPNDPRRRTSRLWRDINLSGLSPDQLRSYFERNHRSFGAAA